MALFEPLGIFEAIQEDVNRVGQVLSQGADTIEQVVASLTPTRTTWRGQPVADRQQVLGLYAQGLDPEEIATRVGVTSVRIIQILRQEGVQLRPRAPTDWEIEAMQLKAQRREAIIAAHNEGLPPVGIAQQLGISPALAYRALAEAGLPPHSTAEALRVGREREERLEEMLQLREAGFSGTEIARRIGISQPRVVQLLQAFPPPRRSHEFEQRAADIASQVESMRHDPSEDNIEITKILLTNLAEDAGAYTARLPREPAAEMDEERWRVAYVRQQARRALEEIEVFRSCQTAVRKAEASALPALAVQARRCVDRALRLLRQATPPPPRPSPLGPAFETLTR